MTHQIPLALNLQNENTFSNYYSPENEQSLKILNQIALGRGEHFIYLYGTSGTGKTHLLQACCNTANKKGLRTFYISLNDLDTLNTDILDNLESFNLICIDDIQNIATKTIWEESIFDLFNRIHDASKRLIISGNTHVNQLNIKLPDLISRLLSGIILQIQELSDEGKINALMLRAHELGFNLPESVAQFIFKRYNRNMNSLFSVLMKLDKISLEEKRKLTIPFVKFVLKGENV